MYNTVVVGWFLFLNKRDQKLYHLSLHSFCSTVSKNVFVFAFRPILGMSAFFFKNCEGETWKLPDGNVWLLKRSVLLHWLQREKPELILMDRFLKKCNLTVKKVQKKLTLFSVFPVFFQNGTHHIASFCWNELSGSWHFIKAFKQPRNMISFEKKMPTCLKLVEIHKQKHFWKQ